VDVEHESETTKPICIAPCFVDLKPGIHTLRFESPNDDARRSEADIQVGERSKVVRHAIGHTEKPGAVNDWSFVTATFGIMGVAGGGGLIGASFHDENLRTPGIAVAAGSAVITAVAVWAMLASRAVVQKGTTTEFAFNK
jgi:hypothetical protein